MATVTKTTARKRTTTAAAPRAPAAATKPPTATKAVPPVKAVKSAKAVKDAKAAKPKAKDKDADAKARKPKLVRDSFTIPKAEYAVLDALKQRAARLGQPAKKSELLRAGVKALAAMPDAGFLASLGAVPLLKTGRPAKA